MLYAFLGHQPQLSLLELTSFTSAEPVLVRPDVVMIEDEQLLERADKLGGTMKIARSVAVCAQDEVGDNLFRLMKQDPAKNVAISNYTTVSLSQKDIHDLKERLVAERPIRFVSFDDRDHELLMLKKKHVAEYNLIPHENEVTIAQTVWIFDSLGFAARDRKKPYQDIKRGMLPVKIARIMVNLGTQGKEGLTVLDPFCGTGTVMSEARMVGCRAWGSDLDPSTYDGVKANMEWLTRVFPTAHPEWKVNVADATNVEAKFAQADVIVTEPLMGPLLDARHSLPEIKIKNTARGLDKLYRGALRSWLKILPTGGRVVITLPVFAVGSHKIETISVDTISSLGYNVLASVPYSKPGVTVIRNITILEKSGN